MAYFAMLLLLYDIFLKLIFLWQDLSAATNVFDRFTSTVNVVALVIYLSIKNTDLELTDFDIDVWPILCLNFWYDIVFNVIESCSQEWS